MSKLTEADEDDFQQFDSFLHFFSAAATLSFFASSVQERLLREIFSLTSFHIQEACTPELYLFF